MMCRKPRRAKKPDLDTQAAILIRQGEFEDVLELYTQSILETRRIQKVRRVELLCKRAELQEYIGHFADAQKDYEDIIQISTPEIDRLSQDAALRFYHFRAIANKKLGNSADAKKDYSVARRVYRRKIGKKIGRKDLRNAYLRAHLSEQFAPLRAITFYHHAISHRHSKNGLSKYAEYLPALIAKNRLQVSHGRLTWQLLYGALHDYIAIQKLQTSSFDVFALQGLAEVWKTMGGLKVAKLRHLSLRSAKLRSFSRRFAGMSQKEFQEYCYRTALKQLNKIETLYVQAHPDQVPEEEAGEETNEEIFIPSVFSLVFLRARIHTKLADYQQALQDYDSALRLNDMNTEVLYERGKVYEKLGYRAEKLGNDEAANDYFRSALHDFHKADSISVIAEKRRPKNPYHSGKMRAKLEDYEAALENFAEAKALKEEGSQHLHYDYKMGLVHEALGQDQDAIDDYTSQIEQKPDHAPSYHHRGVLKTKLENHQEALEDFTRAIELKPDTAESHFHKGQAHARLNMNQAALADYTRAIELKPGTAEYYYQRGWTYRALQQYEEAKQDFNRAIALNQDAPAHYYCRGLVNASLELHGEAERDLTVAIEKNLQADYRADCYYQLGLIYEHQDLADGEKALATFTKAIEEGRANGDAVNCLGDAFSRRGVWRVKLSGIEDVSEPETEEEGEDEDENRLKGAVTDFAKALEQGKRDSWCYFYRGLAYEKLGNHEAALADYNQAIEKQHKGSTVFCHRAAVLHQLGRNKDALDDLNAAIKKENPQNADYYYLRARVKAALGKVDQAIVDVKTATKSDTEQSRFDLYLSLLYEEKSNREKEANRDWKGWFYSAHHVCSNALDKENDPKTKAKIYFRMFNISQKLPEPGRRSKHHDFPMEDITNAIACDPENADYRYHRGKLYKKRGDHEAALADFAKAAELRPNNGAYVYQSGLQNAALNNNAAAVENFTRAIELVPNNAEYFFQRGVTQNKLENNDEALADFTQAIKLDPNNADYLTQRALLYEARGDFRDAFEDQLKLRDLDPKIYGISPHFYCRMGALHEKLGEFNKARIIFGFAIEGNPRHAEFYKWRVRVNIKLGDFEAAIKDLENVIKYSSPNAENYHQRATLLEQEGRYEAALDDYAEAAKLYRDSSPQSYTECYLHGALLFHELYGSKKVQPPRGKGKLSELFFRYQTKMDDELKSLDERFEAISEVYNQDEHGFDEAIRLLRLELAKDSDSLTPLFWFLNYATLMSQEYTLHSMLTAQNKLSQAELDAEMPKLVSQASQHPLIRIFADPELRQLFAPVINYAIYLGCAPCDRNPSEFLEEPSFIPRCDPEILVPLVLLYATETGTRTMLNFGTQPENRDESAKAMLKFARLVLDVPGYSSDIKARCAYRLLLSLPDDVEDARLLKTRLAYQIVTKEDGLGMTRTKDELDHSKIKDEDTALAVLECLSDFLAERSMDAQDLSEAHSLVAVEEEEEEEEEEGEVAFSRQAESTGFLEEDSDDEEEEEGEVPPVFRMWSPVPEKEEEGEEPLSQMRFLASRDEVEMTLWQHESMLLRQDQESLAGLRISFINPFQDPEEEDEELEKWEMKRLIKSDNIVLMDFVSEYQVMEVMSEIKNWISKFAGDKAPTHIANENKAITLHFKSADDAALFVSKSRYITGFFLPVKPRKLEPRALIIENNTLILRFKSAVAAHDYYWEIGRLGELDGADIRLTVEKGHGLVIPDETSGLLLRQRLIRLTAAKGNGFVVFRDLSKAFSCGGLQEQPFPSSYRLVKIITEFVAKGTLPNEFLKLELPSKITTAYDGEEDGLAVGIEQFTMASEALSVSGCPVDGTLFWLFAQHIMLQSRDDLGRFFAATNTSDQDRVKYALKIVSQERDVESVSNLTPRERAACAYVLVQPVKSIASQDGFDLNCFKKQLIFEMLTNAQLGAKQLPDSIAQLDCDMVTDVDSALELIAKLGPVIAAELELRRTTQMLLSQFESAAVRVSSSSSSCLFKPVASIKIDDSVRFFSEGSVVALIDKQDLIFLLRDKAASGQKQLSAMDISELKCRLLIGSIGEGIAKGTLDIDMARIQVRTLGHMKIRYLAELLQQTPDAHRFCKEEYQVLECLVLIKSMREAIARQVLDMRVAKLITSRIGIFMDKIQKRDPAHPVCEEYAELRAEYEKLPGMQEVNEPKQEEDMSNLVAPPSFILPVEDEEEEEGEEASPIDSDFQLTVEQNYGEDIEEEEGEDESPAERAAQIARFGLDV